MCPFREWDVAYVLGSLSPDDRQAYERHLAACRSCEHEVCRHAGTAGLLARVPAEWAVRSLEPGEPAPVADLPRSARTARQRRLVFTATTILVAAVIGALVALLLFP